MMKYKRVLIIRPGAIGDTLMLLPGIRALTQASHQVYVAGRRPGIEFLRTYTKQCFDMDGPGWHVIFLPSPCQKSLPPSKIDSVVCFINDAEGILKHNLQLYYKGAKVSMFPSLPAPESGLHVAEHIARCMAEASILRNPTKALSIAKQRCLLEGTEKLSQRVHVVIHPGSGSQKKNYSSEFWLEMINQITALVRNSRLRGIVLLGPAEQDRKEQFIEAANFFGWKIMDCPCPADLVAVMRSTMVFLGHDSGITHLAAMAGAHTIALFRHTDPKLWHPLGPRAIVIDGVNDEKRLMDRTIDLFGSAINSNP